MWEGACHWLSDLLLGGGVGLLGGGEAVVVARLVVGRTPGLGDRGDIRRTQLLDALAGEPLTHVNALLQGLALHDTSRETTSESITATMLVLRFQLKEGQKAYPAPLVSLMLLLGISWTLNCFTSTSPPALAVATTVGSVPWVTMATRGRLLFFLGS